MAAKNPKPLPTVHDHPQSDVVIYDGKCVFCTRQVRNLRWWDGAHRLAFVSLHDPIVQKRFPDLTHEQMMEQMFVIPHDAPEKRYGGAAALRYLSRRLPKLWLAAPFLHVPFSLPLWQWLYQQIARRRYRIANQQDDACEEGGTCSLHGRK